MGTELDQTRLAALHQAAHDLKNSHTTPEEVVERAEVYLAFLTGGNSFTSTVTLGDPPIAPHPLCTALSTADVAEAQRAGKL